MEPSPTMVTSYFTFLLIWVVGLEGQTPQLQDIYVFKQIGKEENRITGRFEATGIVPRISNELAARGIEISNQKFFERDAQ
ncbi:MAG: hypothetical protein GY818_15910 [Planctomycetaceae bacterium]|nr:hypothetical protein [Planctomycetaceae bacterium]